MMFIRRTGMVTGQGREFIQQRALVELLLPHASSGIEVLQPIKSKSSRNRRLLKGLPPLEMEVC